MSSPIAPGPDRHASGPRRTGAGRASRLLLSLPILLAAGAVVWAWVSRVPTAEGDVRTVRVPVPPPEVTVSDTLRSGQTLGEKLGSYGFDGLEVMRLVDAIRGYESPRRLRPGTVLRLTMRPAEPPSRISLELDPDRRLHLLPDEGGEGWTARLDSVPVVTDTALVGGTVTTNLYEADFWGDVGGLGREDRNRVVFHLSEVFAWQIDFYRDIQPGDRFRAAVEQDVRPDGSVRSRRILAAVFENAGKRLTAIRFHPSEGERVEYYDPEGEALRSQFLRSPLEFGRVTSSFSYRRYHPILKRRRPHLGTDYGAPVGTPVRATGGGIVSRAGWWGGYGRVVELRHRNGLRTRYAHLSRLGRGVRPGVRVEQGQTIGYVGTTGLSTAPHLHYEFLRNGRQVNPARLDLPKAEPVPEADLDRFRAERDAALRLLGRLAPGARIAGPPAPVRAATAESDRDVDSDA